MKTCDITKHKVMSKFSSQFFHSVSSICLLAYYRLQKHHYYLFQYMCAVNKNILIFLYFPLFWASFIQMFLPFVSYLAILWVTYGLVGFCPSNHPLQLVLCKYIFRIDNELKTYIFNKCLFKEHDQQVCTNNNNSTTLRLFSFFLNLRSLQIYRRLPAFAQLFQGVLKVSYRMFHKIDEYFINDLLQHKYCFLRLAIFQVIKSHRAQIWRIWWMWLQLNFQHRINMWSDLMAVTLLGQMSTLLLYFH